MAGRRILREIHTDSEIETEEAGFCFAKDLKSGDVIGLEGELGTGKTVFVKGIARGLGVGGINTVDSPTFKIVNDYYGDLHLHHVDLYRLTDTDNILDTGLFDLLDETSITVIEWIDRLYRLDIKLNYHVQIEFVSITKRKIIISIQ